MQDGLTVWFNGFAAATIAQPKARLRLSYTSEALGKYDLGTPLLSLRLPLRPERYPDLNVRPFLDGFLPEGDARNAIAAAENVKASDTYSLIRALGRDCAGALVILPADQPPPPAPTTRAAAPLTQSQLADLVANLRSAPLGVGDGVRLSLAGVQEKLVLTRMPDGGWGRPVDGTPSTHILKPEAAAYPNTVENEAFCMRFAGQLGLSVAHVETTTVSGRNLLVVERYDRIVHRDGTVERVHQEDFCQALGIPPHKKYQDDGGPSLRRIAAVLDTTSALESLLAAVTVNVLIGNGDAHGKNFSLLYERPGAFRLAPLYDLVSTLVYGQNQLAMHVDDVRRTDRVTADRIVNEAVRWGLTKPRARAIIMDLIERAPAAADVAASQTQGAPLGVRDLLGKQIGELRRTLNE